MRIYGEWIITIVCWFDEVTIQADLLLPALIYLIFVLNNKFNFRGSLDS